jgi:hypothetical protein
MNFSVVIPTCNRASLLPAALASVFAQEHPAREVIVVDDGSTDGTGALLQQFAGRVTVLRQQNRGPAAARNLGIAEASGDYVAFLDSDDLWFPWTLATYRRAIEANQHPALVAGAHVDFADAPPALTPAEFRHTWFPDYLASAEHKVWIGTCGAAVRADALRLVGGFADHAFNAEDSDLWLRLGVQPGFVQVHAPTVFAYRRHGGSAIAAADKTCRGVLDMIACEQRGGYPGGPERAAGRRRIIARHARPASLAGSRALGWQIYRETLAWNLALGHCKYLCGFPPWMLLPRRRAAARPCA